VSAPGAEHAAEGGAASEAGTERPAASGRGAKSVANDARSDLDVHSDFGADSGPVAAPAPEAGSRAEFGESVTDIGDDEDEGGIGPIPERLLRPVLWLLLGIATVVLLIASRELPWLRAGVTEAELTGRELLRELPLSALAAGALLLVVFVASVTLCVATDPWLPGTALGAAVLTLYAAPVALGREPEAVGGAFYTETAGFLAEAAGLDGPGPLLHWAPLVLQLLCLVPLWLLLAKAGGRLSWQGRWGVVYLAAVGGWVWRAELAPLAPPLLLLLVLAVPLLSLRRPALMTDTTRPPHHTRPNGMARD
jgi:hypothetical protein